MELALTTVIGYQSNILIHSVDKCMPVDIKCTLFYTNPTMNVFIDWFYLKKIKHTKNRLLKGGGF